jgi:hypothetical protein
LDIRVRCKFARPGPVGVSLTLKTLGMTRVSELSPLGLITVTEGRDIAATWLLVSSAVVKVLAAM